MGSSTQAISYQNPETTSAIRIKSVTGSHLFKIFEYSLTEEIGIGKCYNSDVFTVSGYNWIIEYYPDGRTYDDENFICFLLRLKSEATQVKAQVAFTILQQNGKPSDMYYASKVRTFRNFPVNLQFADFSLGLAVNGDNALFAKRTKFEASQCLKDDAFTVKCTVTVVKETHLEVINNINVPPSNLNEHFVSLLESGKGADVTFEVNGEKFKAHRCVLAARSAVFAANLFGCMKEKWTDTIIVDEIEAPVFKSMLYFIYSDSLPDFMSISDDDGKKQDQRLMAQHLIAAADRFDLERLRLICEDILCKNLDVSTVATTLILAEQHNCTQLKAECLKFVSSREVLKAVALTDEFHRLMISYPSIFKDL